MSGPDNYDFSGTRNIAITKEDDVDWEERSSRGDVPDAEKADSPTGTENVSFDDKSV